MVAPKTACNSVKISDFIRYNPSNIYSLVVVNLLLLSNMNYFSISILLLLYACYSAAVEICIQNSDIECIDYGGTMQCTIKSMNGTAVSQWIFTCSYLSFVQIYISPQTSNIELDLRISSSATVQFISSAGTTIGTVALRASSISTSVTEFQSSNVIFNLTASTNFTEYFPNLLDVDFKNPIYSELPNFSENNKLTSITVSGAKLPIGGDYSISNGFISGLSELRMFEWTDSAITSIIPRAFSNLPQLSSLKLSNNNINHLRQFSFQGEHLPILYYLWLIGNNISQVDDLTFDDLELNTLYLDSNPLFPLESLANISSLQFLTLSNNGYTYLSPDLIHNLDFHAFNLRDNPFNCTCDLQWTNIAQIFISFVDAICAFPLEFQGLAITNSAPYANCTQTSSYQCFNHSILCMGSSQCVNTATSAFCSCTHISANYGYSQIARDCIVLLDECAEGNPCTDICTDTVDSYECSCNEGYQLTQDNNCIDFNECVVGNGGCDQECENNMGSFECGCFEGFQLDTDTTCIDINECFLDNADCEQVCMNTFGSYACSCHDGYRMSNETCVDIDECESEMCQYGCVNSIGSFACSCSPGYDQVGTGGEFVCGDLNECATANGNCSQFCFNTKGSFYCACYIGYEMSLTGACIDIDECTTNNPCDQECINNLGGYACRCIENYVRVAHGVFVNCTLSGCCVERISHFLLLVVLFVFLSVGIV